MAGYGMQSHVMWNFQNSYGTLQITSLEAIPFVSETLELNINQIEDNSLKARFYKNSSFAGERSIEGSLSVEAQPEAIGFLLSAFTGADDVTDHVHTFKMQEEDFDGIVASRPFTTEVYRDQGSAFLYYDCVGNTIDISVSNGELVNFELGVIGGGFSKQAASSPTFPTGQTPFKWDQTSASFDDNAELDITELTITGNKNLEALYSLQNSSTPRKIKRSGFEEITVTGNILFQSHSYFDAFNEQTTHQLIVNFQSNSPNNLTIDIPQLKFTAAPITADGPGVIEMSFTANAEFNVGSNTAMEINLTNVRTIAY